MFQNILERGRVKWCFREESVNNIDNGWRFLSEIDTDEFLADSKTWSFVIGAQFLK